MRVDRLSRGFRSAIGVVAAAITLAAVPGSRRSAAAEAAGQAPAQTAVAPKPYRMADGRLNWTGFWVPVNGMLEKSFGLGGTPAGARLPSGGFIRPPFAVHSELKSPYKEQQAQFTKDAAAGKIADPLAACFPPGMPGMMVMIYGMEVLQTPGQIAMTSEWQAASRRIWLNQKAHTAPDDLDPTYAGESIGHWEGDTLVVDTTGVRSDVHLNNAGLPHSDKMHIIERFSETRPGILQDIITIDDPDAFVATWTEMETYKYRPDLRIKEYVCLENNRNVGPNGQPVFSH